jgi:hypothetical protein
MSAISGRNRRAIRLLTKFTFDLLRPFVQLLGCKCKEPRLIPTLVNRMPYLPSTISRLAVCWCLTGRRQRSAHRPPRCGADTCATPRCAIPSSCRRPSQAALAAPVISVLPNVPVSVRPPAVPMAHDAWRSLAGSSLAVIGVFRAPPVSRAAPALRQAQPQSSSSINPRTRCLSPASIDVDCKSSERVVTSVMT